MRSIMRTVIVSIIFFATPVLPVFCAVGSIEDGDVRNLEIHKCSGGCVTKTNLETYETIWDCDERESVYATDDEYSIVACDFQLCNIVPDTKYREILTDSVSELVFGGKSGPPERPERNDTDSLKCFTGVSIGWHTRFVTGALMDCEGFCTNLTVTIINIPVQLFICDVNSLCNGQSCDYFDDGHTMHVCCCNNTDTCNVGHKEFLPSPLPDVDEGKNHTNQICSIGVSFQAPFPMGNSTLTPNYFIGNHSEICKGTCANITLEVQLKGYERVLKIPETLDCASGDFGTLFLCDTVEVCTGLLIENRCHTIETLLKGCCCSTDLCNYAPNMEPVLTTPLNSLEVTTQLANGIHWIPTIFCILFSFLKVVCNL